MLKIDSRKAGLVHFCNDKTPFSEKKSNVILKQKLIVFYQAKNEYRVFRDQ